MKTMSIYEPAMCCDTGICGVGVDSELIRVSAVLNALKKNGVEVGRYNLSSAPNEFIRNKTVNQFLNDKGVEGLPAVVLDGEIIITGRYPTNGEFVNLLGIPESYLSESKPSGNSGCSCGDSDEKCL